MLRYLFYLFLATLSLVACENAAENKITSEPQEIASELINNTGLVTKGSVLFGSKDDAKVYLEANLLHLDANTANAKADSLRRLYQKDSNNVAVNFELGTNNAALGGFTLEDKVNLRGKAIVMLTQVIESNPKYKNGAAYFNRAQTYAVDKNWDAAIADINTYLEIDPEPTLYTQLILANANYSKGDSVKACEHAHKMQEALGGGGSSATSIWKERCK